MGSPHMLHVIAKINGRYRPLAVLFRAYDNKGEFAVDKCRRIIAIFQEPLNRALLLHELELAGRLAPEEWEWGDKSKYPNERPAFPFVATCLLLGASVAPETGKGYNATHEPFNVPLAAAEEGCTILDITDPAAVRYAFVFVLPPRGDHERAVRAAFSNTPLTACEYASFYDDPVDYQDCGIGEDDEVISSARARFIHTLKTQKATDATSIASPLIDEGALESAWPQLGGGQSWRRRTDLGLAEIVAPVSSASDPAALRRQPAAHHVETLHNAFERSYKMFQPGYNEGLDKETSAPALPVKQVANILYIGSLEDSSWQERVAGYEPKSSAIFKENAVQYFTFQVGDCPVTSGQTLDVIHSWMVAATAREELGGELQYRYYPDATASQSDENMVKFFSLAGPNRQVVKPLPGRAFYYGKSSYHSSGDWTMAGLEDIRQGEWTVFLIQQWRRVRRHMPMLRNDMTPLSFKCAFITRGVDGEILTADAEAFRSTDLSSPEHKALVELDPGEETYGRKMAGILAQQDPTINGVPVSLMGRPEVLELLSAMEVVKAREDELLASSWSEVHRGIVQRRARESDAVTT